LFFIGISFFICLGLDFVLVLREVNDRAW